MLTSKQRAYLKSEAAKLIPVVQVGKGGASPEVVKSAAEALAARELIKGTVLENCFDDVRDIAEVIAERTRSQLVQTIGRKFVLYKPSDKSTTRLIQFYTFKNAVKPPFLGGFFVSRVSAS